MNRLAGRARSMADVTTEDIARAVAMPALLTHSRRHPSSMTANSAK